MRILHTADWHLGKIVNEYSMLDLQKAYLEDLIQQAKDLKVEALIMAGDLYDRSIPPKEAISLANWAFTELTQNVGIPVFVIAGNHDSKERVEYGADLLASSNLFIEGTTKQTIRKVAIAGVNFYLCPYEDHRVIREKINDETIKNPEEALHAQLKTIQEEWNAEEVNILLYHGFVVNYQMEEDLEESDSERPLSIGTAEYISANLVEEFDYVALGHLHKAQKVKSNAIRYSGSPLKYSKSEANHKKQNLLIDITKDTFEIESLPIQPLRDLKVIRGMFQEIMETSSEDYIFFELEDKEYVLDAMNRLRKQYPFAMGLEYIYSKEKEKHDVFHSKTTLEKKSLEELFDDFYSRNIGMPLNEEHKEAVNQTLREIAEKEKSK